MGFYIIDGPNGSGKTTTIKNLAAKGYSTFSSPHGTELSKLLRDVCRGVGEWNDLNSDVQLLLFAATRTDEYVRLVEPYINEKNIIADRWWTSTFVYQVCNGGSSISLFKNTIYSKEHVDGVILLDAQDDVLIERVKKEREANAKHLFCQWTLNVEVMKKIASFYRKELIQYVLHERMIDCHIIDTTVKDDKQVLKDVERIICGK